LYAMILIVLRRPREWTKTDKQGNIDLSTVLEHQMIDELPSANS
jgi:hypothetical protein